MEATTLKIILVNQTFYPDLASTAQHSFDLCRYLSRQGHQVTVVTSRSLYGEAGAKLPSRETVEGIDIHRVGLSLFGKKSIALRLIDFGLFYVLALLRAITLPRADVIIALTTPPFIATVGYLRKLLRGTKFVYWVMDLYPDTPIACGMMRGDSLLAKALGAVNNFTLRHADCNVLLGRCMENLVMAKGAPAQRCAVIPVWNVAEETQVKSPEQSSYRKEWQLEGKFVVMYSGNLGIGHDAKTLYLAAEMLRDHPDIRFVFVGGGKRAEELKAYVQDKKLDNVFIKPYQPRAKLSDLLALGNVHMISLLERATGVMLPSKVYGIMGAGRPAIFVGSPRSEVAMVLTENNCGFVVKNDDVDGLAELIKSLPQDPNLELMGRRGQAANERLYKDTRCLEAWDAMLQKLVQPPLDPQLRVQQPEKPAPESDAVS